MLRSDVLSVPVSLSVRCSSVSWASAGWPELGSGIVLYDIEKGEGASFVERDTAGDAGGIVCVSDRGDVHRAVSAVVAKLRDCLETGCGRSGQRSAAKNKPAPIASIAKTKAFI